MPFIESAKQTPFVRLLIPFIVGIIAAIGIGANIDKTILTGILLVLLILVFVAYFVSSKWSVRWIYGLCINLFLFTAGVHITKGVQTESELKDGADQQVIVKLLEPTDIRTTSLRVLAKVISVADNSVWVPVHEKVILYFSASDSLAKELKYGANIVLTATFSSPPEALNPYQFNHKEYLRKKLVHRTAFVSEKNWHNLNNESNSLIATAHDLRDSMFDLYKRVGIEDDKLAVLSALTTGYKNMLDQETRRIFSASGAMHILAVSGLHVGILFATLSGFLFFLGRVKRGKLLKSVILIAFLWFFAIFTGLSPSVIRASLMFTLVIIGMAFSRKTNIYNTLSASAFIILAINPLLITEVGFQLSYLALLSIVYFYPHFYGLLFVKNKWLDKIWALVCVSLAAQVGTFVLGIYYFNQFPNYFLFTNLYAIPLASIILYLSVALIVVSPVPFLAAAVGWLLNQSLTLLINLIRFTESLPFSTLQAISISQTQAIMLVSAILMTAIFLEYRKSIYIYITLICLLVFTFEMNTTKAKELNENEIVVFAHRNATAIGFRNGNEFSLIHTDTTSNDVYNTFAMSIGGYMNKLGIKNISESLELSSNYEKVNLKYITAAQNKFGSWINYQNKIILIPSEIDFSSHTSNAPLDVDILILNNQSSVNIKGLLTLINPNTVVIDQTVPLWKQSKFAEHLNSLNINYFDVRLRGAIIISL